MLINEKYLVHLENTKSKKWTWIVFDYLQGGWDGPSDYPHVGV